ncbi:MAG: diacylglycerol kinase family lipid kinase [Anaerolineales bacterium]|nr:diacylglycerol kinase family lipid kinase [Anaerolineales bacterium]
MQARVILNPYSGRWKALKRRAEAEAALRQAGIAFDLVQTERPGHGTELAEQAARQGCSPIIVAGGDGAIGEVVNGLHRVSPHGPLGPLGILPLGTANDLVHNLGLPLDLPGSARAIAAGNTRRIDLGKANEWVFANNSAVGLEPVVTLYNIRMVRLQGVLRYLVAALRAINDQPRWSMRVAWDEGEYDGPVSLVSVGNCPLTGGLFRMAPAADPADGRLTFVLGYAPTRRKMLSLLPRTINGSFVRDPAIQQHHCTRLQISCDPPTPIQLDGEIRAQALSEISYEVLPARLDVLCP